jgi:uncharacterized protein
MTTRTEYAHGEFCWTDVATTDPAAAKRFYGRLFGWEFLDQSPGEGMIYTDCRLRGKSVAGLYALSTDMLSHGVPPHWLSYIAVRNADEAAKKAGQNGGTVIEGPFDVADAGRMAPMRDPTGAHFAIWQAKKHLGAGIIGEPGAMCWNELMTRDTDAAGRFYASTFDWSSSPMDMGPAGMYTVFKAGTTMVGGMMAMPPQMKDVPPNWGTYFAVADCDATAKMVPELGGATLRPPTDIPSVGRFAVCRDGQGAVFAVIKLQQNA